MRKRRAPPTTLIEQSLRDAHHVLTRYIESGGKQVTDTIGALMNIFASPKLGSAVKSSPRRGRSTRRGATAKRAAGHLAEGRSTGATRNVGRKAAKASPASRRGPSRRGGPQQRARS